MSKDLSRWHLCALVLPGLLLAVLPVSGIAKDGAVASVQKIKVYPDHYTAGGKRFADLATLEKWVKSTGTRSLELHGCMWTATDRLVAAIERFPNVYLDVRWITPGTLGCPSVATDTAARSH